MNPAVARQRIVLGVTSDQSLRLLDGFPAHLNKAGWDVHVVSAAETAEPAGNVTHHSLRMERDPSPLRDLLALVRWWLLLRRLRPDVVVSGTPKAGLLGMMASAAARVPVRIYLLRGLRLATEEGRRRALLLQLERVAARCATRVLAISASLRIEAVNLGIVSSDRIDVLGAGSSNGVRIRPLLPRTGSDGRFTVGYVGRLHPDKGVDVLVRAMADVRERDPNARLVLVGGAEPAEYLHRLLELAGPDYRDWVESVGQVANPEEFYPGMDVLCLPTKREGFGNVILEAGVQAVPAVASRVTGCVDAVVDGSTGLLFKVGDHGELAEVLNSLRENPSRVRDLGAAARERVLREFANEHVWALNEAYFREQLMKKRSA